MRSRARAKIASGVPPCAAQQPQRLRLIPWDAGRAEGQQLRKADQGKVAPSLGGLPQQPEGLGDIRRAGRGHPGPSPGGGDVAGPRGLPVQGQGLRLLPRAFSQAGELEGQARLAGRVAKGLFAGGRIGRVEQVERHAGHAFGPGRVMRRGGGAVAGKDARRGGSGLRLRRGGREQQHGREAIKRGHANRLTG
ncbi:hypothetical protein [Falsiroseomonas stagni]|uniref:hypothetical protein n=1 Tax=Falsiroseomonas stagni TaxID=484882 RepID=UPI001587C011|nr:hypothetical protein [Falsiroseomonas stagni]